MSGDSRANEKHGVDRQVVAFRLDGQLYGLHIERVREILQMVEITAVPDAPPHVKGAIDVRGAVLPILDIRMMLGLASKPYGLQTPILVIESGDRLAGLPVDEAVDVTNVPAASVEAASEKYPMSDVLDSVARIDSELLLIFDAAKLLGGQFLPPGQGEPAQV